jgi:RimK family alpha-L-glutamate ligase
MTTFLLHRAGIPTPPTWVTESAPFAQRVLMRESASGHDLVIKPLFGSQGKGIARIGANSEGCEPLPALKAYGQLAYLQRLVKPISTPGYDWRVMVIGGKAVTAMRRVSEHWVHNVAQGAHCEAAELDEPLATLAERASAALGLDYAGVDLIPCDDSPYGATVIEVNGVAAWRGLQTVTPFDIAGCIVDDLLNRRMALADRASHVKEVA